MKDSILRFYHANGTLWRVVALESLNPGWVPGRYVFRSDLREFEQRLARIRRHPARRIQNDRPTLLGRRTQGVGQQLTPSDSLIVKLQ